MQVVIENVTKLFGRTVAVDDFSAMLDSGNLTALLGPSGCGKSTILNMLAGIIPATKGRIFFDGEDVTKCPPEKRGIGLVFQNYALYPHMTVLENICFPLEIQKVPKPERLGRAKEIAEMVRVEELLNRRPDQLSGGQQQRVAIARALVKMPRLLLLDEPLSNLDARLRLTMREEIRRIQRETQVTTVFVTHDQEEAMSISDNILLMKNGKLQQSALPQALYNQPSNLFAAQFLGNPPINQLRGVVQGDFFVLHDGSGKIPLSGESLPKGIPLILGIRAESIAVSEDGFSCKVKDVFEIGKEEMATLSIGSAEVRAYIPAENGLSRGDDLGIRLKNRGVFLFDAETGDRRL